ncbi:hypothetical protein J2S91_003201 [Arthrobacter bambusae]|nr:hypothetical protein [Arthrobacter bambusae]
MSARVPPSPIIMTPPVAPKVEIRRGELERNAAARICHELGQHGHEEHD